MSDLGGNEKFRCDDCGKFIAMIAIIEGRASRKLIMPDNHFGAECYETLCEKCHEKDIK